MIVMGVAIVVSLMLSGCGAATDVGSSTAPTSLALFDDVTTTVEAAEPFEDHEADGSSSTTTTVQASTSTETSSETTTTVTASTQPTASSTTAASTTTVPLADPNAAFCQAAIAIDDLGAFTSLDDTDAAAAFFNTQADRWDAAADVAPASIAVDVQTVATFHGDVQMLLERNDFNLFAVFEELTELEASSGSDVARIRTDQFTFANCEVAPPLAEQATAAFYGQLLASADDRTFLAELLASAEVFSLDGAVCFVDNATPDVMHPLVGAPATAAQDTALASVLSACQLSIGSL